MIKCKVCGKEFKLLIGHISKKHGLTSKGYQELYPGSKMASKETSNKKTKSNKTMWKTRDKKLVGQQMLSGRTEESYSKMAESQKVRLENLSDEKKEVNKSHLKEISKSYWNEDKFEESRKSRNIKISKTHKSNFEESPQPYINRMNKANKVHHKWLQNCSAEELDNFLKRSWLKLPKIYKFPYKGSDYQVRSSYEEIVLKRLVDLEIKFEYEPTSIKQTNGKYYRPDFLLTEFNIILEVKADYWYDESKNILRQEAVEDQGYKYLLIKEKEIFEEDLEILNHMVKFPRVLGIN